MLDKEPYMSGETVFWRSLGENKGFFQRYNTPIEGEGFWRSQGLVPIISNKDGIKWVFPNDLYTPEDAFRRWGNEVNPLMAIFINARESVLNALAKYVWNTKEKKVKLGFEVTGMNYNETVVYRHYTSIYMEHHICQVDYEEEIAYPDPLSEDEETNAPEVFKEPIEEMSLNELYEIINFINQSNNNQNK